MFIILLYWFFSDSKTVIYLCDEAWLHWRALLVAPLMHQGPAHYVADNNELAAPEKIIELEDLLTDDFTSAQALQEDYGPSNNINM